MVKMRKLNSKKFLVTGCCGTVGTALIDAILKNFPNSKIIGIDINESELFRLYKNNPYKSLSFELCDLRSNQINFLVKECDVIFHCAAYKHVYFGNQNVEELKSVNIDGLQNILASLENSNVKDFVFCSSDKAANPTSSMGITKLLGERLVSSSNKLLKARCSSVRFGNVIGSSGSVYEIFRSQINKKIPLTLTDEGMTRFIMTAKESASLLLYTSSYARGGEVFISKMPTLKILDLAKAMISYFNMEKKIKIKIIGSAVQEKLYEELMTVDESKFAVSNKKFFILDPNRKIKKTKNQIKAYRSDEVKNHLDLEKITNYIKKIETHDKLF